jgi:arsenate reductase (thioredoxin)
MTNKPIVLFLCTHNAGRSLAAKVLLDHYSQGRVDVRSAGSEPADEGLSPRRWCTGWRSEPLVG